MVSLELSNMMTTISPYLKIEGERIGKRRKNFSIPKTTRLVENSFDSSRKEQRTLAQYPKMIE